MTVSRLSALLSPSLLIKSLPLLVALGISAFITYTYNASLRKGHVMVEHSMEALAAMDQALSLLKDAETGQRGFVITGDEAYLAPYERARGAIEPGLQQLDALIDRNPAQHQAVGTIRAITARKLDELAAVIATRRSAGLEAAAEAVRRDSGKSEMDDLRKEIDAMKGRERAILQDKSDAVQTKSEIILLVSIAALIVSLIGRTLSSLIRIPGQFSRRSGSDKPTDSGVKI